MWQSLYSYFQFGQISKYTNTAQDVSWLSIPLSSFKVHYLVMSYRRKKKESPFRLTTQSPVHIQISLSLQLWSQAGMTLHCKLNTEHVRDPRKATISPDLLNVTNNNSVGVNFPGLVQICCFKQPVFYNKFPYFSNICVF